MSLSDQEDIVMHARVAVIESNIDDINARFERHTKTEEEYMRLNTELIQEIREEQAKMKGFWGGVVFVFSALGVALAAAVNRLFGSE